MERCLALLDSAEETANFHVHNPLQKMLEVQFIVVMLLFVL
jgi:hypothetical protein